MNADNTPDGWLPAYIPDVEEWRPVVTHPGRYEVSSSGQVRAILIAHKRGCLWQHERKQILAQSVGGRVNNYKRVMLHNPQRHAYVHHLMAESFIGPRPPGCEVLHGDDNGFHNWLGNIRYGDEEENRLDRHVRRVAKKLEGAPF